MDVAGSSVDDAFKERSIEPHTHTHTRAHFCSRQGVDW